MEWLIAGVGALVVSMLAWNRWEIKQLKDEIQSLRISQTVRQATIKQAVARSQRPTIDSRAKTSMRDTDDLPRSGRMGSTLKRKSEPVDREYPDGGLQEDR